MMLVLIATMLLSGCGAGSMQDLTRKAEKARTRQQLEDALGKPDKFEKYNMLGLSAESWTYKASDGEVNFTVLNDRVKTVATLPKDEKDSKQKKLKEER